MYKGLLAFVLLTGVCSFGQYLKVTISQGESDLLLIDDITKITFINDEMLIGGTNNNYSLSDITKVDFSDQPTNNKLQVKPQPKISNISVKRIKNSILIDIPEGYRSNPMISVLNIQGQVILKKRYSGKLSSVKYSLITNGFYVLEIRSANKVIYSNLAISK